ncbi:hypothetical protein D3C78_670880 [compost metagenome]
MAGADETLGQLVGQVLGFQGHLPGHVEGNGVGAVGLEQPAQAAGGVADGLVHAGAHRVAAALVAQVGVFHASGVGDGLGTGVALGAEATGVGGVGLVAGHLDHAVVRHLHDDAAADTAIRTHASNSLVCHSRHPGAETKKRHATHRRNGGDTAPLSWGRAIGIDCLGGAIARHMPSRGKPPPRHSRPAFSADLQGTLRVVDTASGWGARPVFAPFWFPCR